MRAGSAPVPFFRRARSWRSRAARARRAVRLLRPVRPKTGRSRRKPSAEALPYDLDIVVEGEADIADAFETVPPTPLSPARRSAAGRRGAGAPGRKSDLVPFVDALWGLGYYNARCPYRGRWRAALRFAARNAAGRGPGGARLPAPASWCRCACVIEPGEVFRIRQIRFERPDGAPLPFAEEVTALEPGDPAESAAILAAQANVSFDYYRARSRPFAEITSIDPVVIHPRAGRWTSRSASRPDPSPASARSRSAATRTCRNTSSGPSSTPSRAIRISPEALAAMRRSIGRIEAISAVRVNEASAP